ncbi:MULTISPECIES: hypothetical protein [unclassified Endozoicomonas]|uniref:hypothetical protein n=1 Tax=unclassified Endozoicomonas TaxID=2644528 RepID=UPI003BB773A3
MPKSRQRLCVLCAAKDFPSHWTAAGTIAENDDQPGYLLPIGDGLTPSRIVRT